MRTPPRNSTRPPRTGTLSGLGREHDRPADEVAQRRALRKKIVPRLPSLYPDGPSSGGPTPPTPVVNPAPGLSGKIPTATTPPPPPTVDVIEPPKRERRREARPVQYTVKSRFQHPEKQQAAVRPGGWWDHPVTLGVVLVLCPPVGVACAWSSKRYSSDARWALTIASGLMSAVLFAVVVALVFV